jgi:16S rRNA (adenine1518-N6/adenine1519-N6)-dimethyltransferase
VSGDEVEREKPSETLGKRGLRPKKSLGQNFLSDPAILESIVDAAAVGDGDVVLEVGPGTGNLTRPIASRAGRIICVELDRDLAKACRELFAGQDTVTIVEGDALDHGALSAPLREGLATARAALGGDPSWKLVANLPYNAAARILTGVLAHDPPPACAVVTVQREMADRFRAKPGGSDYGALSVRAQLMAEVSLVRHLPAGAFWPRPNVRSSVIKLVPRADRLIPVGLLDRVIGGCFEYRRKQIPTALVTAGVCSREQARAALAAVGLAPELRGETLAPQQFASVAAHLDALLSDR